MPAEPTDSLFDALTLEDPEERADAAADAIAAGADCAAVRDGQNVLSVLLGAHRHLGARDGEIAQRLVDGGADVNFRERRGALVLRLAVTVRTDSDEDRRPLYEAIFGTGRLDLSLPSNANNPVNTLGEWLRMNIDKRPGKLDVLDEYL